MSTETCDEYVVNMEDNHESVQGGPVHAFRSISDNSSTEAAWSGSILDDPRHQSTLPLKKKVIMVFPFGIIGFKPTN